MKIILTADVTGLGESGDIVEVKDGHARNLLLPRGWAIVASKGAQTRGPESVTAIQIASRRQTQPITTRAQLSLPLTLVYAPL